MDRYTMDKSAIQKYEVLKAMNTIIAFMNHDGANYEWDAIMDCNSNNMDVCESVTMQNMDIMDYAVETFIDIVKRYGDYGMYIGNKVYNEKE